MMGEQKGRGGKKPKYQIADIGGSDLTPQDISTERVLNFLIKGEAPAEQDAGAAADSLKQAGPSREQTAAARDKEPAGSSLPPSDPQGKKSLDHLFRRASAGGGGAKDLKHNLRDRQEPAQVVEAGEFKTAEQVLPAPIVVQIEGETSLVPRPAESSATEQELTPAIPPASPSGELETHPQAIEAQELTPEVSMPTAEESAELSQLISLWKSFYRLNSGEVDALCALYQISHGQGSDECYVKMHKLAEMSSLTYRYCQKVVRSLEQLGWLTKLKDYDASTQSGVLYRVNLKPSV